MFTLRLFRSVVASFSCTGGSPLVARTRSGLRTASRGWARRALHSAGMDRAASSMIALDGTAGNARIEREWATACSDLAQQQCLAREFRLGAACKFALICL